jgi:hypothetical protein
MYLGRVWKVLVLLLTAVSGNGYVQLMHEEDWNAPEINEKKKRSENLACNSHERWPVTIFRLEREIRNVAGENLGRLRLARVNKESK